MVRRKWNSLAQGTRGQRRAGRGGRPKKSTEQRGDRKVDMEEPMGSNEGGGWLVGVRTLAE